MDRYVLGFLFDETKTKVLLLEAQKPEWQKDKWNGVGGSIELGESPLDAMTREFHEEAGVFIPIADWNPCMYIEVLEPEKARVNVFTTFNTEALSMAKTQTEEALGVFRVNNIPPNVIPNLKWIIPMLSQELDWTNPLQLTELWRGGRR